MKHCEMIDHNGSASNDLSDDQIMKGIMELLGCSMSECESLEPHALSLVHR